ncbi:MAG: YihY/virulence factor BrkB family protein [Oscillospiraceae bacterium]|nr:YihY/virulence factor BrkB family protein [Oscillospiraceae bacterium]
MRGAFFQLPPVLFVRDMVQAYGRLGVSRAAASLAYFLILTLFPLLVCVNFFIGLLELDPEAVFSALDSLLPRESLSIILEYLTYVSGVPQSQSTPLLLASLFTILLSASAGLRTLLKTMDELYQVRHVSSLRRVVVSVALSILFLLTIYLSIVVIFTGDWFFQLLEARLPSPLAELIPLRLLSQLWGWLRYLLLFFCVLLLVLAVYRMGTPPPLRREKKVLRLTALLSAGALVACSVLFSWFIGMSSRYSLVYGSLASLIILLVWLYFCGNILLVGAVAGRVWFHRRDGT